MPGNEYREIIERLDRIENHLAAPGTGIFIRVDRVEQKLRQWTWVVSTIAVAFIAVAVASTWAFVDRMNRWEQQANRTPIASSK